MKTPQMINTPFVLYFFFAVSILMSCQSTNNSPQLNQSVNSLTNDGVSIEISMPHGDSLRWLGVCWSDNPVDIIIRNQTDSVVYFYEDWNSWGYYNLKFEIETSDSIYTVSKTRNVWWRNFPSYHSINPDQSLVFHCNLTDSSCFEHNAAIERMKGLKQWTGLPQKEYESAKIRVIYELPDDYTFAFDRRKALLSSHLNEQSDSVVRTYDTIPIFSQKLISESLDIKIIK